MSDGKNAHKMLVDKSMTFCTSFVSMYNQVMAIMDTIGRDAKTAATGVNLLPSSDTPAMISADTMIFIMYCMVQYV